MTDAPVTCRHCGSTSGEVWVDANQRLMCGKCNQPAPFVSKDGTILHAGHIIRGNTP